MTDHRVGFIGTGADPENPSASGVAMASHHADAYRSIDNCDLVACTDLVTENAEAFADERGIDDALLPRGVEFRRLTREIGEYARIVASEAPQRRFSTLARAGKYDRKSHIDI